MSSTRVFIQLKSLERRRRISLLSLTALLFWCAILTYNTYFVGSDKTTSSTYIINKVLPSGPH